MATITQSTSERVYPIRKWLGLNQASDGKTRLKMGEASEMVNFRVTPDGVLKKRPGIREVVRFSGAVNGSWHGYVSGVEHTVVAAGGNLYDVDAGEKSAQLIGYLANLHTEFFGFGEKLYILAGGVHYKVWDGTTLSDVANSAYVPVVVSECPPAGGGTELEGINLLSDWRRVWFSPDGTATTFKLPERAAEVMVKNRATGQDIVTGFNHAPGSDTVTFNTAPDADTDSLEIKYKITAPQGGYPVRSMKFAELYNGTNENRVFLYGDGSNRAIYSGINENGEPDASYFPALNQISIGDENTPITQLIRHFSRLLVFKTDSAYSIYYGQLSDADGKLLPAFYWNPVNKAVGNAAPGQVRLVDNNPITLFEGAAYQWRNTGGYSSNLTIDERQAKRISDRVWREFGGMDLKNAACFDDNERKEWYCLAGDRAAVYNYGLDVWYLYDHFHVRHMLTHGGRLYGSVGNRWVEITDEARNDFGSVISAKWASGYMAFDMDYKRKYSSMLWIAMEPMVNGEVNVTIETDRKAEYTKKVVARNRASFEQTSFASWSFKTSSRPYVTRLKIKAKKYTYYRLILTNESNASSCAITAADFRVRYTGYVR